VRDAQRASSILNIAASLMNSSNIAIDENGTLAHATSGTAQAAVAAVPFAVDCEALSKRYGRRWALVDVGFKLPAGTTLLVAGRNGSGKSTLFRLLSSALSADGGDARIAGHPLADRDGVRRSTAVLGHYAFTYESLTALENLAIAARVIGRSASQSDLRQLLARVGLEKRANDAIATYSAGMRKRLSLARVLMQDAQVVLLDEPYGQLDPSGFRLMDSVIQELKERRRTVLIATHLLQRGAAIADFALVLRDGRLDWSGSAAELPHDIINAAEDDV
jgi:heme exporter protein A